MSPALFRVTVEPLEETCLTRADGVTALLDLSAISFIDSTGLRVRAAPPKAAPQRLAG